jgi:hypothetical protein
MPDGLNTYNLNNLLKGPCNVLYADPEVTTAPTKIADLFDPDGGGYQLKTGWSVFGATTSGTAYGRQFQTSGHQIEQATGNVAEEVVDVVRTVQLTAGEISPEMLQLMEQAPNIDTLAKAKGHSAEKQIRFGKVEELSDLRIAFVGRRLKGKGADVKESGGATRGAFVVGGLWVAQLTGDAANLQIAKGNLAAAPLTLQAYPDTSQPEGEEHGFWFVEEAGTIEAAE